MGFSLEREVSFVAWWWWCLVVVGCVVVVGGCILGVGCGAEELDVADEDFVDGAVIAFLVLVFARLHSAADGDLFAFCAVLRDEFGGFTPSGAVDEVGFFFSVGVFETSVHGDGEVSDCSATLSMSEFRIAC